CGPMGGPRSPFRVDRSGLGHARHHRHPGARCRPKSTGGPRRGGTGRDPVQLSAPWWPGRRRGGDEMLVKIKKDSWIGSGACVIACREVFGQDDDGLVVLLNDSPPPELQDRVVDASKACPASVIWTTR